MKIFEKFRNVVGVTVISGMPETAVVNVAVQVLSPSIVTCPSEQSASPLQIVKVEPVNAKAVRFTVSPKLNDTEQIAPQSMPEGELETKPDPVPVLVTMRLKF